MLFPLHRQAQPCDAVTGMMHGISRLLLGVTGTLASLVWLWTFAPPAL